MTMFADFLGIPPDDWNKLLVVIVGAILTWVGARLEKVKMDQSATKSLINGRVDDLLKAEREKAFAEGHAAGTAKVMDDVAKSDKVSIDAQGIAEICAANNSKGK